MRYWLPISIQPRLAYPAVYQRITGRPNTSTAQIWPNSPTNDVTITENSGVGFFKDVGGDEQSETTPFYTKLL